MANWYVWSGATAGGGTGADWANAYLTLQAATAAKAASDVFYVAHDHNQTQASALTITFPGTEAIPNRVYCVDRAGSFPPVSADLRTTAVIATTGAFTITLANSVTEINGIIFSAGDAASSASIITQSQGRTMRLVNCLLKLNNTATGSRITSGGTSSAHAIWENVAVQFGNASQQISVSGRWVWRNTPNAYNGTVVNLLIAPLSVGASILLEGIDLSAFSPNKTLFVSSASQVISSVVKDCKLGTGTIFAVSNVSNFMTPNATLVRSDSGDTTYRVEYFSGMGNLVTETTIVRTGGASDGVQTVSWKFTVSSLARWEIPFESLPITIWNETTGSPKTVTIQGIWGSGSLPKNDDIWIDVVYFGTAGSTAASRISSTKANGLAVNADVAAGSGTWGGSTTKFALSVTFTPQKKGPITIYVKVVNNTTNFYIDPKPVIT